MVDSKLVNDIFLQAEEHLNKKILKYNEAIKEALTLNDMNIQEKSLVASSLHHGFINCLFAEKEILEKLEDKKKTIEDTLIAKFGLQNVPKYESENTIKNKEEIKILSEAIKNQRKLIQYLTEICDIVKNYSYNIKNATELLKLSK